MGHSFGGLLREVRHYAHKYMHEVLVDLMYMQRELHPGVFTVMDGTIAGDGAGPRTMIPRVKNLLLAASDSVGARVTRLENKTVRKRKIGTLVPRMLPISHPRAPSRNPRVRLSGGKLA